MAAASTTLVTTYPTTHKLQWLNLRNQDVYTAGDDGSGGTYSVVTDPPPGFPFIPRYVNENVDIVATFEGAPLERSVRTHPNS